MVEPNWKVNIAKGNLVSYHTNGLDKYGSLEIEVVLPLQPEKGVEICNSIGVAIIKGLKLEDGLMEDKIFNNPVFFFKTMPISGDKEVFRVIFPDENGFFPWDMQDNLRCATEYKQQITFTKDKVFFIILDDTERIKAQGLGFGSPFYKFVEREGVYMRPAQYFITGKEEGLIRMSPYCNSSNGMLDFMITLEGLFGVRGLKVVCVDVDYSDHIHSSFVEWKENHW